MSGWAVDSISVYANSYNQFSQNFTIKQFNNPQGEQTIDNIAPVLKLYQQQFCEENMACCFPLDGNNIIQYPVVAGETVTIKLHCRVYDVLSKLSDGSTEHNTGMNHGAVGGKRLAIGELWMKEQNLIDKINEITRK